MAAIDFSQFLGNQTTRGFLAYCVAIAVSLVLGQVLYFIHRAYSARTSVESGVQRSFVLIAPSVTAIFLVIQFSLPLSLGLLGALSFIRFRTPIKEAEDSGFLMVLIASSLACAVFRFEVAALLICLTALLAVIRGRGGKLASFLQGKRQCDLYVTSGVPTEESPAVVQRVLSLLNRDNLKPELVSLSSAEGQTSLHLVVRTAPSQLSLLPKTLGDLKALSHIAHVNFVLSET